MNTQEAHARIKINKLLEKAGWRLLDDEQGKANVQLEQNVKIKQKDINDFGTDFEKTKNGFVDFLLLDDRDFPLAILEAKKVEKQKSFLEEIYNELIKSFDDDYEMTPDDIAENFTTSYYFSEYELKMLAENKKDIVSKFINEELY